MTTEQKHEVSRILARYATLTSQNILCHDTTDNTECYMILRDSLKKLNIDFNTLSELDYKLLGFNQVGKNWLIPVYLYDVLPKSLKVENIFDGSKTTVSKMDTAIAGGCFGYKILK